MKGPKRPRLTVDAIIVRDEKILLIKRGHEPYRGYWALPGGFVEGSETVEEAIKREVLEETSLDVEIKKLVGVYSEPNRDPRGHSISIAYVCEIKGGRERHGDDASDVRWFPVENIPKLGFDHEKMISDALNL